MPLVSKWWTKTGTRNPQLQLVPAALALQHLGVVVDSHVALETEHTWTVAHVKELATKTGHLIKGNAYKQI